MQDVEDGVGYLQGSVSGRSEQRCPRLCTVRRAPPGCCEACASESRADSGACAQGATQCRRSLQPVRTEQAAAWGPSRAP
eukprot:scaffold2845_cov444-Prasinococcus_capsulatus_cf.AAC.4